MTVKFQIEHLGWNETIEAITPQQAWAQISDAKEIDAGGLVRFRELPWNGQYIWDKKPDGRKRKGQWYYVSPSWFSFKDERPPETDTRQFSVSELKWARRHPGSFAVRHARILVQIPFNTRDKAKQWAIENYRGLTSWHVEQLPY